MRIESAAENRLDLYSSTCLPSAERKKTQHTVCEHSYSFAMWRVKAKSRTTFIAALEEVLPVRGVIVSAVFGRTKGQRQQEESK